MNKLISSALMTIVAVPFLMAAPAAKKVQNTTTPAATTKVTSKKMGKKASKKVKPAAVPTTEVKK